MEEEAERIAMDIAEKWRRSLEDKGKTVTAAGLKRYRENAKRMAMIKLEMRKHART